MTPEQAERMASTQVSQRELRHLRAMESIAGSLAAIHQTLALLQYKWFEENCMEQIAEMVVAPPAVEVKEKAGD